MERPAGYERIGDPGPLYRETQPGRFPVEPWNAVSTLIFLGLFAAIAFRTRFRLFRHPLLVTALPVLSVGMVGGFLYHATRARELWLNMDFFAMFYLVVMMCLFFWHRVLGKWLLAVGATLLPPVLAWAGFVLAHEASPRTIPRVAFYAGMALTMLVPTVCHCAQRNFQHLAWLASAAAAFTVAVFFREIDQQAPAWLPMGTHFLWHLCGAVAAAFIAEYIFRSDLDHEAERAAFRARRTGANGKIIQDKPSEPLSNGT
jgi:hemolysin III